MRYRIPLLIALINLFYSCGSVKSQKKLASCIQLKIDDFIKQPVTNPSMSIYRYNYNNSTVYFISAPCCDSYTILYDQNCKIICRPSGGLTGKGDGKCSNFFEKTTGEKIIWKDDRKSK